MKTEALEKLIWILIFGGLLVAALGLFVARQDPTDSNAFGGSLMSFGGVAAAVGVVLIYVRSRMGK
jgi:hypothetical protein